MHYGFFGWHAFWIAISWIVGIGIFTACIWLLALAVHGGGRSPEEVLRQRYAEGEIDTDELNRRLSELHRTKTAA
jgi:uncharacterized membrane protein